MDQETTSSLSRFQTTSGGRARAIAAFAIVLGSAWLVVAALAKLADLPTFRQALEAHSLVPHETIYAASVGVPVVEMSVGILAIWWCCSPNGVLRSGIAVAACFLGFAIYAFILVAHPPPKPSSCGCGFSSLPVKSWAELGIRNLGIGVLLSLGAFVGRTAERSNARSA